MVSSESAKEEYKKASGNAPVPEVLDDILGNLLRTVTSMGLPQVFSIKDRKNIERNQLRWGNTLDFLEYNPKNCFSTHFRRPLMPHFFPKRNHRTVHRPLLRCCDPEVLGEFGASILQTRPRHRVPHRASARARCAFGSTKRSVERRVSRWALKEMLGSKWVGEGLREGLLMFLVARKWFSEKPDRRLEI